MEHESVYRLFRHLKTELDPDPDTHKSGKLDPDLNWHWIRKLHLDSNRHQNDAVPQRCYLALIFVKILKIRQNKQDLYLDHYHREKSDPPHPH
jgi:hypothetical protein